MESPPPSDADKPTIKTLLGQLANDTSDFARAEIDYLRAQAGERASYALPGLIMLGLAASLGFGAIVALLVGLCFWLAVSMGTGWAVLIIVGGAAVLALILARIGAQRIGHSLKARADR